MPSEPQRLDWDSVSAAAGKAFSIWVGQPELRWAKMAWDHLERAGLTMFTSELGRCRVALRFLALAGIYHDFCAMAWEERQKPEYSEWASEMEGLTPYRIGQLIGSRESDEDAALERLVLDQRRLVRDALVQRFGGVSALFASLWQTRRALEDDEEPETDDEILNVVTSEKMAAFGWLENGCDTVNYDNSELDQ